MGSTHVHFGVVDANQSNRLFMFVLRFVYVLLSKFGALGNGAVPFSTAIPVTSLTPDIL